MGHDTSLWHFFGDLFILILRRKTDLKFRCRVSTKEASASSEISDTLSRCSWRNCGVLHASWSGGRVSRKRASSDTWRVRLASSHTTINERFVCFFGLRYSVLYTAVPNAYIIRNSRVDPGLDFLLYEWVRSTAKFVIKYYSRIFRLPFKQQSVFYYNSCSFLY